MPAKWFCDDCGREIWQGLSQIQKETETVADMERSCMCSDCIIKNEGFRIRRSNPCSEVELKEKY